MLSGFDSINLTGCSLIMISIARFLEKKFSSLEENSFDLRFTIIKNKRGQAKVWSPRLKILHTLDLSCLFKVNLTLLLHKAAKTGGGHHRCLKPSQVSV